MFSVIGADRNQPAAHLCCCSERTLIIQRNLINCSLVCSCGSDRTLLPVYWLQVTSTCTSLKSLMVVQEDS